MTTTRAQANEAFPDRSQWAESTVQVPIAATPVQLVAVQAVTPPRGKSTAGMVLGIIALGLVWLNFIPWVGFVMFVLPVLGIILSLVGLKTEPAGKGRAVAGIVMNGVFFVVWLIALFVVISIIGAGAAFFLG